ncbi:MAG: nitrilase-related carbon-nitrogen hydrolase [Chloroflexota bacterium]
MPVKPLPNYEVIPLRSEEIRVAIVQSRLGTVDPNRAAEGRKLNLKHLLWMIDYAQARTYKDLLAFHEFPLGGLSRAWTRQECLKVAIDVPGPETEAIGRKAKEYGCYIEFGCYARLPDWPEHFFNLGVIIGPDGSIIYKRWWLRNLAGVTGIGTTVWDVLDEFVRRYGWEAIFPVARTDIGNIALMSEVLEPELRRAFAMRGAEIGIHCMVRGTPEMGARQSRPRATAQALPEGPDVFHLDFRAACLVNHIYGLFIQNAVSEEGGRTLDGGVGRSVIYDCNGAVMAEVASHHEGVVETVIPIAAYRKKHSIPRFQKELFTQLYQKYVSKYPPNLFLKSLPDSIAEGADRYRKAARW